MVSSNATVDFIDFPYRYVAVSKNEQALRLAQNLANGGGLDYYLIGRIDQHEDRTGEAAVKQMFHFHYENESEFKGLTSIAEVALLKGTDGNVKEFRGWFRLLTEHHLLFDTIHVDAMPSRLSSYKTIIIPDYEALPAILCEKLDQFVEAGGLIISSGRTAFRNESYEPLTSPQLACLGVERIRMARKGMRSAYIKRPNDNDDSIADLFYLERLYVYAEYKKAVIKQFKLIPPHPYGPPERCYYTDVNDNEPGYAIHSYGKGASIYIPWLPGELFYEHGYENTFHFIQYLLTEEARLVPIKGDISPLIQVTLAKQEGMGRSFLLQLVNHSGHTGVSYHAPLKAENVTIRIPNITHLPGQVTSLTTGQAQAFGLEKEGLEINVSELNGYEAIKIEG